MRESQHSRSNNWFSIVRKKFFLSSSCPRETAAVFHTVNNTSSTSFSHELTAPREGADNAAIESVVGNNNVALSSWPSAQKKELSEEDIVAIKIQAFFRAHLARRALRALKSVVKLQAVVRGACVRRQARIALHCMHALARLQITVRARQLLS